MYIRETMARWWHYVKGAPAAMYTIAYSHRHASGNLYLGIPAGIFCAVICWFMIDWMIPAIDGTRLSFVGSFCAAKSSFNQVSGVNFPDLEWSFWARLKAVLVINYLIVSLGTGSDIRDWRDNGVRPERWALSHRCILAFSVCAVIASLLVRFQPHQSTGF